MRRKYLVAICRKHSHEVVMYCEVMANDEYDAVYCAFVTVKEAAHYRGAAYWGEAVEI